MRHMKRYLVPLFCNALFLAGATWNLAGAQGSRAAAQVHIDKAKAAAYRPGSDLTHLYEFVCAPAISEKRPTIPDPKDFTQTSPTLANRKVPPKSEWMTEPAKVFDNLILAWQPWRRLCRTCDRRRFDLGCQNFSRIYSGRYSIANREIPIRW
jgi:hypothetical protein